MKKPTPRHGRRQNARGGQHEEPAEVRLPSQRRHELKLFLIGFLATLVTVSLAFLFDPSYQAVDDVGMRAVAENPSEYLIFISLLIGRVLKHLYQVWPGVFWYDIYLYAGIVVAGATITYALLRLEARHSWLAAAFVLAVFWLFPLRPQFTIVAGLCAAASIMLIFSACLRPPETRSARIWIGLLATACFILAILTRSQQAWFVLVGCLLVGGPLLITLRRRVPWKWATLSFAAVLVAGLVAVSASTYEVRKDAQLREFLEFNAARAHIQEYIDLNWKRPDQRATLQSLGWTQIDLRMFQSFFAIIEDPITTAKLQEIIRVHSRDVLKRPGKISKLVASEITKIVQDYGLLILAAVAFVIALPGTKRGLAALGWGCLVVAGLCLALALARKGVPYRVSAPLVFGIISISILWSFRPGTDTKQLSFPSLILAAILVVLSWTKAIDENEVDRRWADLVEADLRSYKPPSPNAIHVWWGLFRERAVLVHPFAPARTHLPNTVVIGWGLHSPAGRERLTNLGITRLETDICGSADMVLIAPGKAVQLLVDYLDQRHGMKTYIEPIFEGRALQFYRCKMASE